MEIFRQRYAASASLTLRTVLRRADQLSVVQTAVAASKTAFAAAVLSLDATFAPVVVGLLAFAIYNANDLADVEEDAVNRPAKTSFVARWRPYIVALAVGATAGAVGLALWRGGVAGVLVTLVPLAAALVYSAPVFPGGRRAKDVYLLNTALVATAWAVAVTYVPVVLAGATPSVAAGVVCVFVFLRTVVSVEVFNVRDVAGDGACGVDTLPVVLGTARTKRLLAALDVGSMLVVLGLASVLSLSLAVMAGLVVVGCYSVSIEWLLDRIENPAVLCQAKDLEYLAMGLLVVGLSG